jgi:hypothetical protein
MMLIDGRTVTKIKTNKSNEVAAGEGCRSKPHVKFSNSISHVSGKNSLNFIL